ncbi:restriction endonuclease subunit S [Candidatus Spongiisocius sp.]|uniref:restriction endonuclease subunit S n=1 Tax=Candidatus Spongiisocius sp. TaxID=3101273 RepID=UPI003B5A06A5
MAEWESRPIEELVSQVSSGGTPRAQDPRYYTESGIPFLKIDDITKSRGRFVHKAEQSITRLALEESAAKVFPAGTVLVTMYGTMGVTKTLRSPMATNQAIAALVPPFRCDPDYLALALSFRRGGLERLAAQTTQPNISGTIIRRFQIPIPPLEEQRRIAEILDTIDETIQTTERVIAKQRVILAGLQESLLEVDDGATRTTVGDLVSGHWPGEWGEAIPSVGSREVIVLRATNLDDYGVDYSTGARRFVSGLKVAEKRLMDGDLLVEAAGGGPGVPVGRVRRFRQPADDMPYLTSNFFRALRPKAGVSPDYLFWMLDLEYRKPSIWSCQQQTTGIINLQVRDYLRRPVIYHHRSQGSIARTLNAALRAVEVERQQLQKLRETRSGLAADLLSGRVRTVAA